ncbi:MOFRL family protein [Shimia sp.]|uniref:MOFRL family protein n=1 Tax=Shimia sp. TaxID=1954381 RepID=UPI003BAABD49
MSDNDQEDSVSFYFRVSCEQTDQFNQLAAAQFGMKKGAKRQMFLKLLDGHLRSQKIAQLKEEISVLEKEGRWGSCTQRMEQPMRSRRQLRVWSWAAHCDSAKHLFAEKPWVNASITRRGQRPFESFLEMSQIYHLPLRSKPKRLRRPGAPRVDPRKCLSVARKEECRSYEEIWSGGTLDQKILEGLTALAADTSAAPMRAAGRDPAADLATNNAYCAFEAVADLYAPGPTGTNVNDFRAILLT